jgi:hypothetical protein
MRDYVLFQMWEPLRRSLVKGQQFYIEQASKRLLSQFNDIESEADKATTAWLEERTPYFDPDRHDPSDLYEAAHDAGVEFYQMLSDLRDQTRLSVVAGMYHEWDKQLREWLAREMGHWHMGGEAIAQLWKADFGKIIELLECLGWSVRSQDYFSRLDACRLVINVYKHGNGSSLSELRTRYPEYLRGPFEGLVSAELTRHLDHTHLELTYEQCVAFSDTIVAFWEAVPEQTFQSQVNDLPGWFGKAIERDRRATQS